MPELPEVESVRMQLEKYVVGHTIERVEINYQKCFQGDSDNVVGGKVRGIRRFGKALSIDLDNKHSIVIHIKLTGQLIYRGPNLKSPPKLSKKVLDGIPGKHTHVIFRLNHKGILYYNDVRKFGWIKIVRSDRVEEISFIKSLGPEPLDGMTLKKFSELTKSTKRVIKTLLMDQSKIGGVGNIYANDALWLARISPTRSAGELSDLEIKRLFNSIEDVLREGLKRGGASELSFVTPDGTDGDYQDHFLAYGKEGDNCPRKECRKVSSKFSKIKMGGRGTYFCPACQK